MLLITFNEIKIYLSNIFVMCQMLQWPHGQTAIALDSSDIGHFPLPQKSLSTG